MKCLSFFVFFLLAVLGSTASGEPKADRRPETQVAVFMQFDDKQSELSLASMKQELESIMSASGLYFDWRMLDGSSVSESFPELVVVKFKGACRMEGEFPGQDEGGTLAYTHTSDGEVLPFIDVECDRIRGLVGAVARTSDAERREYLLGRALGRVLAHEFYHVFAKTRSHGHNGVAKAFFTANELVSDRFHLASGDRKRLQLSEAGGSKRQAAVAGSSSEISVTAVKALR